jgi:6-phosphogluconolactonase (cycloisomerase 2 family)
MKRLCLILDLVALAAVFCLSSFAATEYVIVNNGNYTSNSATLYKLNTKSGKLVKAAVLDTGGQASMFADNLAQVEQAVTQDAGCIFVFDDGSSDVAAFSKATGYSRVGDYFNANLIAGANGGSLTVAPDGKFLYGGYSSTVNIGVWKIASDCTLSFTAAYSDGAEGPIKVTPNGKYIVATSNASNYAVLFAIDKSSGALTSIGTVAFVGGACARIIYCEPHGLDITKDSKFAVFASTAADIRRQHAVAVALTARITSTGLVNPRVWVLKNSANLAAAIFPFFSAAGYAGSGNLYFGVWASGPSGVLTSSFQEKPMKFTVTNAIVAGPDVGNIAVTGNLMVVAQYPNQIQVFRIKKDGSLTLLTTTTIDDQGEGLFSLSIFPNTR